MSSDGRRGATRRALLGAAGLGVAAIAGIGALRNPNPTPDQGGAAPATGGAVSARTVAASPCSCGLLSVPFGPTVPGDAPILSQQADADCFAWWEFISLNWPTAQGAGFGDPGDLAPVQWETYMPKELLFQPGAATPPPWGTQPTPPPSFKMPAGRVPPGTKLISATSKFTTVDEAAPKDGPNWLGAQNGTNAWYEVRINQDEYNFVVDNKLYDANQQAALVNSGKPIVLPKGSNQSGGPVGSIELKAAWMEVPDPQDPKWKRYKLSSAVVLDPVTQTGRSTTLALAGLHILHKTETQPTWIWATFEHVDNVPGSPKSSGSYNFFNPNCQSKTFPVPSNLLPPQTSSPVTVSCTPNTPPPYYLGPGGPGPVPIQVSRTVPIDSNAQQTNSTLQAAIARAYPNSVWQYYQVVNVVWSTSPSQDPVKPAAIPRTLTGMLPPTKVSNVTLETYAQGLTCTDCHKNAAIAPTTADPKPQWSSDFSFALGSASTPPAAASRSSRSQVPGKGGSG